MASSVIQFKIVESSDLNSSGEILSFQTADDIKTSKIFYAFTLNSGSSSFFNKYSNLYIKQRYNVH